MFARTLRITGLAALVLAFLLTCTLAAGLVFGWWRVLPVQSGSMAPTIPKGAAVVVTPQRFDEIVPGQIIVYDPPTPGSSLLVHRVVEVIRNGDGVSVRTRGDANAADDPWTAELADPPVWKVRKIVPHAGNLVDLLRNRMLRLALFPLALLGLAVAALATVAQMPSVVAQLAAARGDEAGLEPDTASGTADARPAARAERAGPTRATERHAPRESVSTPSTATGAAVVPPMTTVTAAMLRTGRATGFAPRPSATPGAPVAPVASVVAAPGDLLVATRPVVVPEVAPEIVAEPVEPLVAEPVVPAAVAEPVVPAALPATPADWYRDPTGRFQLRWFDGERWTAHVVADGERRTDPLR